MSRATFKRSSIATALLLIPLAILGLFSSMVNALLECHNAGDTHVVLDLGDATLANSRALETISDAHQDLLRIGGQLALANAQPTMAEILRITRLELRPFARVANRKIGVRISSGR